MSSNVTLSPSSGWTELHSSGDTCIVSYIGGGSVVLGIAENSEDLTTFAGHSMPRGETWPFYGLGSNKVFARSMGSDALLSVSAY